MKLLSRAIKWVTLAVLLPAGVVCGSSTNSLEIKTTPTTKFSYVCSCKPGVNYPEGKPATLHQGYFSEGGGAYHNCSERFLLQFEVPTLPPGAELQSATLMLRCQFFYGRASGKMVFNRISAPWNKDKVSYDTQPTCTLEDRIVSTNWPKTETWFSVNITDWVRLWQSGVTNYGLMGYSEDSTVTSSLMIYAPGAGIANRPKVILKYTTPDPAALDARKTGQGMVLEFRGETNRTYYLQSTTNLAEWREEGLVQKLGASMEIVPEMDCTCRYYRLRVEQLK